MRRRSSDRSAGLGCAEKRLLRASKCASGARPRLDMAQAQGAHSDRFAGDSETDEPRGRMTLALSYFLLCAAAKVLTGWIHGYEWSWATPVVLLWQDALLALCIAALSVRSKRAAQLIYWPLAV